MSDGILSDLLLDMCKLIEDRKLGMTPEELIKARAFVASISMLCGEATEFCNRMHYSDFQAREYMRGLLAGIVERQKGTQMQGVLH